MKAVVEDIKQRGFTLLEVLVAFSIAATAIILLMQLFGDGLRQSMRAGDYARATSLAESLLSQVGTEYSLQDSPRHGVFDDRFEWTIEVSPYPEQAGSLDNAAVALDRVYVRVEWPDGMGSRRVELSTLKLRPAG